jgi:hypothetical protein
MMAPQNDPLTAEGRAHARYCAWVWGQMATDRPDLGWWAALRDWATATLAADAAVTGGK